MSDQPSTPHFCAVCVGAFQPGMPPLNGHDTTGQTVFHVTMRDVLSGRVTQVWSPAVSTSFIPMRAVTVVQGTLLCEIHAHPLVTKQMESAKSYLAPWQMP